MSDFWRDKVNEIHNDRAKIIAERDTLRAELAAAKGESETLRTELQRSLTLPVQEIETWRCAHCDYAVRYDCGADTAIKKLLRNHAPCRP